MLLFDIQCNFFLHSIYIIRSTKKCNNISRFSATQALGFRVLTFANKFSNKLFCKSDLEQKQSRTIYYISRKLQIENFASKWKLIFECSLSFRNYCNSIGCCESLSKTIQFHFYWHTYLDYLSVYISFMLVGI